jgi:hypothetical protein
MAPVEREVETVRQRRMAAWAVRTLARTDTFVPMDPTAREIGRSETDRHHSRK